MNDTMTNFLNNLHRPQNNAASPPALHSVNCPIPDTLFHELETMAEIFDRDISSLAGNLLTLSLHEALKKMPQREKDQIEKLTMEHELQKIRQMQEASRFNAGGT